MADEDEYEMIPHKLLSDLKDEVQGLKEKLDQPSLRSDMISTILELKTSLKQLHTVIQTALDAIGKDENDPSRAIADLHEKVARIEQQNTEIAQALVTVADLVENINKKAEPMPLMSRPAAPLRALPPRAPPRMAPPPRPPQQRPMGMPPLPPPPELGSAFPPPPPPPSGGFRLFKK